MCKDKIQGHLERDISKPIFKANNNDFQLDLIPTLAKVTQPDIWLAI